MKVYKRAIASLEPSLPKAAVKTLSVPALSTPFNNSALGFKTAESVQELSVRNTTAATEAGSSP